MAFTTVTFLYLFAASLLCFLYLYGYWKRRIGPLPPGPKKLPIIGNFFDMTKGFEWEKYKRWGNKYNSDILHLEVLGQSIVILNSLTAANDLMVKRALKYSGRPFSTMVNELMGWDKMVALMQNDDEWREKRRLYHTYLHPSKTSVHQPHELKYVHRLLSQILEDPENLLQYTTQMAGSIALTITYGIKILPRDDPYITLASKANDGIVTAGVPGAFLVDMIPWLKYVPEWMPGAEFKRKARGWREDLQKTVEIPFAVVQREMSEGQNQPSLVSAALEEVSDEKSKVIIKEAAAQVFSAGVDTTNSTLDTFLLAMACFPDIQKKAQQQLDQVLSGRLPIHSDMASLPYISALVKETLRWKPVAPIGMPHQSITDDVYRGYHIPKGAIVIGNVWAMLHDEKEYPEPSVYKPERFLKDDGKLDPTVLDPNVSVFGFGRRICPGSHLALSAVWIAAASVLSMFEISNPVDMEGKPVKISNAFHSSLICRPLPFKCTIKPRSKAAEALIRYNALPKDGASA